MPIQWRTDYAIRLMYEAARLGPGKRGTVQNLAAEASVSYDFARQIANDLVHAGLLVSHRGAGGGMELARPAAEITILDILRALNEPPSLAPCTVDPTVCSRPAICPIHHGVWQPLDDLIEAHLSTVTLEDCVARGESLRTALKN